MLINGKKVDVALDIRGGYDGFVEILVFDNVSRTTFLELKLTYEQFVNAALNRLAFTQVAEAYVANLDKVGMRMDHKKFEFPLPPHRYSDKRVDVARAAMQQHIPEGWVGDREFSSQGSFFEKDGVPHARTIIRRWVPVGSSDGTLPHL